MVDLLYIYTISIMIYDNFTILMIITITILITSQRVHLHMSAEPPFCSEDFMTWTHGPMDPWTGGEWLGTSRNCWSFTGKNGW
jgi:hypothetical protein